MPAEKKLGHGVPHNTVVHQLKCWVCGGDIGVRVGPSGKLWAPCNNLDTSTGRLCDNKNQLGPHASQKVIDAYLAHTKTETQNDASEPTEEPEPAREPEPVAGPDDVGEGGGSEPDRQPDSGTVADDGSGFGVDAFN